MIVDRTIVLQAPAHEAFERVLDIPFVGACLPGASDVVPDGDGTYRGRFTVRIGPVAVKLDGTVRVVEANHDERTAVLRMEGADRGIGGNVSGDMSIRVFERAPTESELVVHTDVTISGRIGQFGQPVIQKKADQITGVFVDQFSRQLTLHGDGAVPALAPPAIDTAPIDAASGAQAAPLTAAPPIPLAAGVHTIGALFRQGRLLAMAADAADVRRVRRMSDLGAIWLGDSYPLASPPLASVPWVTAVRAESVAELTFRLSALGAGAGGASAVAVVPRGEAVGSPALLGELGQTAAIVSGRAVVLVAETAWGALLAARVAAAGAAQGVAIQLAGAHEPVALALLEMAVREVRHAGVELPVLAGPVRAASAPRLRRAGADGVIVAASPPARRLLRRQETV